MAVYIIYLIIYLYNIMWYNFMWAYEVYQTTKSISSDNKFRSFIYHYYVYID